MTLNILHFACSTTFWKQGLQFSLNKFLTTVIVRTNSKLWPVKIKLK